jgi:hypothetical protein
VLKLGQEVLLRAAEVWTGDLVRAWFAKDETRVFYFVPQVAAYQPVGIPITAADFDRPPIEGRV